MTALLAPQKAPITQTKEGTLLVTGSRVSLEVIVSDFNQGASAEEIALRYPLLSLADVYAVIAFYLRNQDEVETYVAAQADAAEAARVAHRVNETSKSLREKLLSRR